MSAHLISSRPRAVQRVLHRDGVRLAEQRSGVGGRSESSMARAAAPAGARSMRAMAAGATFAVTEMTPSPPSSTNSRPMAS